MGYFQTMPLRKNNLICTRLNKVQVRNGQVGMEGKNAGNLFVFETKLNGFEGSH